MKGEIGKKLKQLRKMRGLKISELEELSGIKRLNIERYERGNPKTIQILEDVLESMGAMLEIVVFDEPKKDYKRLMELVNGSVPKDYVEYKFITEYERKHTQKGKKKIMDKYTTSSFPVD